MATLNVPLTTDFSADLLSNITRIKFINFAAATATFDASQFDNLAVLDDVLLVGSVGENLVEVNGGSVDASGWRFSGWEQDYDSITLNGSSLADTITGSRRADTITGRNGGDVLSGMNGDDVIKGGRGSDIISGGRGADMLLGGKQADTFHYADQTEIAAGESIDGGDGTDAIALDGAGIEYDFQAVSIANTEELQFTDGGTATFDGAQIGGGTDLLTVRGSAARDDLVIEGNNVDLSTVVFADWDVDPASPDEIIIKGTAAMDVLTGSSSSDTVWSTYGGDTVNTGDGEDIILMGPGAGYISAGGDDDFISAGHALDVEAGDVIDGGSGEDRLNILQAYTDEDYDFTGTTLLGLEQLTFADNGLYDSEVIARFTDTQIAYRAITKVDILSDHTTLMVSGQFVDLTYVDFTANGNSQDAKIVLTGTGGTDVLFGSTLADTIIGGAELDAMAGFQGRDTFVIGSGTDVAAGEYIDGGNQRDTLELQDSFLGDFDFRSATLASIEVLTIAGRSSNVRFLADQFAQFEEINGLETGQDILIYDATNLDLGTLSFSAWDSAGSKLFIYGTTGDDDLTGSMQIDFIFGGDGADVIDGGDGDDWITGGYGRDELTGGAGNDRFLYDTLDETPTGTERDRIQDFTQGEDVIDLTSIQSAYNFSFLGDAGFSASGAAEINYVQSGTNTILQFDGDGNGVAEAKIALTGLFALTVDDFVF